MLWRNIVLTLAAAAACAAGISTASPAAPPAESGYLDSVYDGSAFYLAGTGGRLDRVGSDGALESLSSGTQDDILCLAVSGSGILAGTGGGDILLSGHDGTQSVYSGKDAVCGLTRFQGAYYALTQKGSILRSGDGHSWSVSTQLKASAPFLSLTASNHTLSAITGETDLFTSSNGSDWEEENFNDLYQDFYPAYRFTRSAGMGDTWFILGENAETGAPLVMFTQAGEAWLQKDLQVVNSQPAPTDPPIAVNDIAGNADQLVVACDGGQVLTITNCSVCNQLQEFAPGTDLNTISVSETSTLVAGENFYFQLLSNTEVKQDQIQAEQAQIDLANGALLIDVREPSERAESGYIAGSLSLPLAQVAQELPRIAPDRDQELIFYCASGSRSQTALETAQELGYTRVYNLGALSDWPYGITHD